MIDAKMQKAFNKQINNEFFSFYLYLSMSAYFQHIGMTGFANWMKIQAQEENCHAMRMFDYVIERGGKVVLESIAKPPTDWDSILHVFEAALAHEQSVTALIDKLADVADEVKDRAALSFLQWYINEQVEEEATATDIVNKLKLISSDSSALFMMDQEFALKVYAPPVIK